MDISADILDWAFAALLFVGIAARIWGKPWAIQSYLVVANSALAGLTWVCVMPVTAALFIASAFVAAYYAVQALREGR